MIYKTISEEYSVYNNFLVSSFFFLSAQVFLYGRNLGSKQNVLFSKGFIRGKGISKD